MPRTRPSDPVGVTALVPLQPSNHGVSGSFLVRADDGERYWCKVVNNPCDPRIPVNEQLVGRLGRRIGVAVCEPTLVRIPDDLAGWEFRTGRYLEPGWAHGSPALDGVVEVRALANRTDDENARRHAGFFALHDWLGGSDQQWLVHQASDSSYHSHDHGHYLGMAWTSETLAALRDAPTPLAADATGLDYVELSRLAAALDALTESTIAEEAFSLPDDWPVTDAELEAFVNFADHRRAATGARLRSLVP
jgi:HipA-like kinase